MADPEKKTADNQQQKIVDHDEQMRGYLIYGAKAGAIAGAGATALTLYLQRYSIIKIYI